MQKIQAALLPFHLHRKTIELPDGLTLQEMADYLIPISVQGIDIVMTVNGEIMPRVAWSAIKPKTSSLVGLNVIPAGGGGGKKNPLAMVLTIAVLIAAPYIGAALGPVLGTYITGAATLTAAQTAFYTGIVSLGVSMVGFLATSMLSSVPTQKQSSGQTDIAQSSTQFIDGASNIIDLYGVVPCNLGTNRLFPKQAALPYTESVGNNQYVRQMFTYGYGNVVISARQLGDTALENFIEVDLDERLNSDLDQGTKYYTDDVNQMGYSVTLTQAGGPIVRTTALDTDEAGIDITFASGLTAYDNNGIRQPADVVMEIKYRLTGTTDWSTGIGGKSFPAQSITVASGTRGRNGQITGGGIIVLNIFSGLVYDITNNIIPADCIRIATYGANGSFGVISELIDARGPSIGGYIASAGDFVPSLAGGLVINIAAGSIVSQSVGFSAATGEALRVTERIVFPVRGQYDISITRITADSTSEQIRDVAGLTAIRSITHRSPVVFKDISGASVRMLGTDQLNSTVDQYNTLQSNIILDYDPDSDTWIESATSNPASIYRYALQSPAFIKRLPDERINLEKLKEWWIYCDQEGLTYNRNIDYVTSVDDVLNDIAAAGMATKQNVDSIYGVIIDNERPDIAGMVTPRNSQGYSGNINYPQLPHALRVEFRNEDVGYNTDECIVYADGYDETNATDYERLQFLSCTNSDLAWYYGRRYLATALLQPETHTFSMDFENLTFNRGDRITFVNDVILVGVGSGRIKSLIYDDPVTPTTVTGFVLDDIVEIPSADQFGVRIRHADASDYSYHSLVTVIGETNTFTFATPIPLADAPGVTSLCSFTEFGKELDLIVTEIQGNSDQSAKITALNYAPERFNATTGPIPAFTSNVTIPLSLRPLLPPVFVGPIQSDESVMLRNSDGSFVGRMIIPLSNQNEPSVITSVVIRRSGTTEWSVPNTLLSSASLVVLTGLDDGCQYDIAIRYKRNKDTSVTSIPLQLNGVTYAGASGLPADVSDFKVSSVNGIGLFDWPPNTDIDLDHYVIRSSRLVDGATWTNSQIVADNIKSTSISLPMQSGTYLIKAVDILGNESANATIITSFDEGALANVIEFLQEQDTFSGTKDNCHVIDGDLYLEDTTQQGIYYFAETVSLGDIYTSFLSASLVADGRHYNRIRAMSSIRAVASIRGVAGLIIRAASSIRALPSVRGIDPTSWAVQLQLRTSQDNMATWSYWENFKVGNKVFTDIQFRVLMNSFAANISPRIDILEVTVDMPDRRELGEDIVCPPAGITITYDPPFIDNPTVNITFQNGATDDRLEYVVKNNEEFTIKVFNATLGTYVTRVFDYLSSGYGRKNS